MFTVKFINGVTVSDFDTLEECMLFISTFNFPVKGWEIYLCGDLYKIGY